MEGPSSYGCYLASRPYVEAVRFRSVYLHVPAEMVQAAGPETERFVRRVGAVRSEESESD